MANSFWAATCAYLDEDFDAPDAAADHDLCQAIVAGRMGLHPDVWGAHDPLSTLPPRIRAWKPKPYERLYHPSPADLKAARHWPRPVVEGFEWVPPAFAYTRPNEPPPEPTLPPRGEIQLTCDVCNRHRLGMTLGYRGDRAAKVAEIRALGRQHGWTSIAGIDRCPACSQAAAPKSVGNGAGGNQGNEQHA